VTCWTPIVSLFVVVGSGAWVRWEVFGFFFIFALFYFLIYFSFFFFFLGFSFSFFSIISIAVYDV
jgi:hypothetical protein